MSENPNENENQSPRQGGRVRIDKDHHPTYIALTKAQGEEDLAPFEFMKNLFMLATFIGYQMKERVPLKSSIDFNWEALKDDKYASLLHALAISETGDVKVLIDNSRVLTITEEYANAGIEMIQQQVEDMSGDKVMNLVDLLANWKPYKT